MALLRMAVENYRCFKERQEIELRPITVILGKNNSGKSALTRLPLLLSTGLHTDSELPLDLDQLGDDPPEFLDLVHERSVHRPLRLEFTAALGSRQTHLSATIQNIAEQHIQLVSEFEIFDEEGHLRLEWIPEATERTYSVTRDNEEPISEQIHFSGIIPRMRRNESDRGLGPGYGITRAFRPPIYLGPYRQRPTRLNRLPSRMATEVGTSGENAIGMLVNDHVRGGGLLINRVNELLGDGLDGWHLEVEQNGPLYAINLRSEASPSLTVNLVDSGTGVAHALPLLVQCAQPNSAPIYRRQDLFIIEEPELHLHPAAHAFIADIFIASVKTDRRTRYLVESHSETMLLRLRRRIAEGAISAEAVAVYFVENDGAAAQVRPIEIDESGNLDYWPDGVFSEDFEETKKLMKAQFSREHDAS
ncbi:DUF3696 domain-containing protein [Nonomuraea sp. NPDC003201]